MPDYIINGLPHSPSRDERRAGMSAFPRWSQEVDATLT